MVPGHKLSKTRWILVVSSQQFASPSFVLAAQPIDRMWRDVDGVSEYSPYPHILSDHLPANVVISIRYSTVPHETRTAMPSELDPLLPRNEPAPEIVGYGFSQKQKADAHDESPYSHESSNQERDKESSEPAAGTDTSPLRTILTIFTIVISFGLILSALISGELGKSAKAPQIVPSKPSGSITDRVERILSEHPLIGSPFLEHIPSCL